MKDVAERDACPGLRRACVDDTGTAGYIDWSIVRGLDTSPPIWAFHDMHLQQEFCAVGVE